MFILKTEGIQDQEANLVPIFKKGLEAVEKKFVQFKNIKSSFKLIKTSGSRYTLESEPLPILNLNFLAYMIEEVRLNIHIHIDEEETSMDCSFRYHHRNGGSNGKELTDFGESKTYFIYCEDEESFKPMASYHKLQNIMRSILRIKENFLGDDIPEELETPFILMRTEIVGDHEMSPMSKQSIGASLITLSRNLKRYLPKENSMDSFDRRHSWGALHEAETLGKELLYSITFNETYKAN